MNYQTVNTIVRAIFALPGVTREHDSDVIVEESADKDRLYFKFMSDGGRTDDRNGMALRDWCWAQDVTTTQRRHRSMEVPKADFITALNI